MEEGRVTMKCSTYWLVSLIDVVMLFNAEFFIKVFWSKYNTLST